MENLDLKNLRNKFLMMIKMINNNNNKINNMINNKINNKIKNLFN